MQKVEKRKAPHDESSSPKKKFVKNDGKNIAKGSDSKKNNKDGPNKGNKFVKEGAKGNPFDKEGFKGKPFNKDGAKGKPFNKDGAKSKPFNKDGAKGKKFNKDVKISENYKGKKPDITKAKGYKDPNSNEKPKWAEMKKEKKELRITRRKTKITPQIFEISHKAKMLAAQIQRKVVQPAFRASACKELHVLLKGQYKSIALTHDLSRVIQVLLKHSSDEIKIEISEELLDIIVQMVQSKYGQHAGKRILKYGTDFIRHEVIKRFYGHIVSLASHTISAPVLDYAYGEFATPKEKLHMQQEFYGDIYKNSKDDSVKTLTDAYKGSPEMKQAILSSCKANIQKILDKNLHDSELMHAVLYAYMRECEAEARAELVATLSPLIVPLSNSLPGVNAASLCVWQGTNKDKKTILKVVKEHAVPLSTHKTGYRLLLAIFSSVDDTVLVRKTVVAALVAALKDVAKDHWGRMTLHWLVKAGDAAAFHPELVRQLAAGARAGSAKKDVALREAELRDAVLPPLRRLLEEEPEFWLADPSVALFTTAILSIDATQASLSAVARALCRPEWRLERDGKSTLAVEDAGMHMCMKKLAALDKDRADCSLGESVAEHLNEDTLKVWLPTNRGCFFLLKLIESNKDAVAKKLIDKIKKQVGLLKEQTSQGAKLLLKRV